MAIHRCYPDGITNALALWGSNGAVSTMTSGVALLLTPARTRAIMLDPEFTTPGTVVAIRAPGHGSWQYLRPGDVAHFPDGGSTFEVRNALAFVRYMFDPNLTPEGSSAGYCAFLAATDPAYLPPFRHVLPRPGVSVLINTSQVAPVALPAGSTQAIIVAGLRGMRINAIPLDNVNFFPMAAPADLACTLRPAVLWRGGVLGSAGGGALDRWRNVEDPGMRSGATTLIRAPALWSPNTESDISVSQNALTFDRPVPAGCLAFQINLAALAGTNVGGLHFSVEGY